MMTDMVGATGTATLNTIAGFSGKFKCTYEVSAAADLNVAPGVKLTSADQITWQFQWAEWEEGVLASGTQLWDTANVTPLFTGDISTNAGEWPNPIVSWTIATFAVSTTQATKIGYTSPSMNDNNPGTQGYPGTFG
jgi:hypothetical protein